MRTLRLELTFRGAEFVGWQRQARGRTVQGEVETALERLTQRAHAVVGCGRTDAGVSARRYVASTRTESTLPARRIARGLEALLPHDVGVLRVVDAGAEFHALRDATWKWYRYGLVIARGRRPLDEPRAWRRGRVPELAALQAAARALVGRHDFASFCNAGSPRASTVRTLLGARWTRRGRRLTFDVVGDGFLYKMVRTLVGTQLRAAGGLDPIGDVLAVLAACDRRRAGASAPAHGLTLLDVGFGERPPAWCAGEAGVD